MTVLWLGLSHSQVTLAQVCWDKFPASGTAELPSLAQCNVHPAGGSPERNTFHKTHLRLTMKC